MSWSLIQSIQKATDARLILPFGLALELGDVVGVGKDGNLTREGKCASILGVKAPKARAAGQPFSIGTTHGDKVTCEFRASGSASSISPQLPNANGSFDLSFGSANSWVLAVLRRTLQNIDVNVFRAPILDAYRRGVWRENWALITTIGRVERMTLIASTTANTNVALSLGATVSSSAPLEAKLTADISIGYMNQQVTQCVTTEPTVAFCLGQRVRDPWWKSPEIGTLAAGRVASPNDWESAPDEEFWESVDAVARK
jgi:hypothetical protein